MWRERRDPTGGERILETTSRAGLPIRVLPRQDRHHACCILGVRFGSLDQCFAVGGERSPRKLPPGVAHFLEHLMFEKPRGDLLAEFASHGAHANAMTSHAATLYHFSAPSLTAATLDLLLEVVFDPAFTAGTIAKEQGIIAQEIRGYDDHPGSRGGRAILEGLFRRHPVRIDIGGSVASIARITPAMLARCHAAFYVPRNMVLVATGAVDPELVRSRVDDWFPGPARVGPRVRRVLPSEPRAVARAQARLELPISAPRLLVGFKGPVDVRGGAAASALEEAGDLMLEALFGEASPDYDRLLAAGLIGDDFSFTTRVEGSVAWAVVGGETPDPGALERELRSILATPLPTRELEAALSRIRRRRLGDFLRALDAPEAAGFALVDAHFRGEDLFGYPQWIERFGPGRVRRLAARLLDPGLTTTVVVEAKR